MYIKQGPAHAQTHTPPDVRAPSKLNAKQEPEGEEFSARGRGDKTSLLAHKLAQICRNTNLGDMTKISYPDLTNFISRYNTHYDNDQHILSSNDIAI